MRPEMSVIAYKFQAPDGSYWYIKADDQRTLDYWRDKRKLIPLTDDKARIAAHVVAETGLSDEEIMDLKAGANDGSMTFLLRFARAVERAHGIVA